MTYLQFHAVFIVPWILFLAAWTARAVRAGRPVAGPETSSDRVAWWGLAVHVVIALAYTTPWDNFLVANGVWGYPEGRVWFTIGWVPIEEYAFFVLQTILTGLVLFAVLRARGRSRQVAGGGSPSASQPNGGLRLRLGGAAVLLVAAGVGAVALGTERGTYLGLILVWALPVVAIQWLFGGDVLVQRWRSVVPAIALPTAWLWFADRLAIGAEIWWISPELTVGWTPLGLPIEEATFFLITNVMVVFGLSLVLEPASWARWQRIRTSLRVSTGTAGAAVLGLWALSMIPAPLVPNAFPVVAYVSTGLLALGTLLIAWSRFGRKALLLFGVAVAFGLVIEVVGSATGVPFGTYTYRDAGPAVLGVPWLVPLGWWAFTVIAVSAAPALPLRFGAPLVLVAWDLGLDPLMVHHGFWRFDPVGPYAGVPWVNFVGWFVAGWLLIEVLQWIEPRLAELRGGLLRWVFVAQGFFLVFGLAFFGMPVPAAVTALAMGSVALSWRWVRQARTLPEATP